MKPWRKPESFISIVIKIVEDLSVSLSPIHAYLNSGPITFILEGMPKLPRKKTVGKSSNRPRIQKRKDFPKPHPPTKKQKKQKSPPTPKGEKPGRPSSPGEVGSRSFIPTTLTPVLRADRPSTAKRIAARLRALRSIEQPQALIPTPSPQPEEFFSKLVNRTQGAWEMAGWMRPKGLPTPHCCPS